MRPLLPPELMLPFSRTVMQALLLVTYLKDKASLEGTCSLQVPMLLGYHQTFQGRIDEGNLVGPHHVQDGLLVGRPVPHYRWFHSLDC